VSLPGTVPIVTYVILGFTVLIYLAQVISVSIYGYAVYDIDWLEMYGARINLAIRAGELWRFITPVFLHASPPHLFFNMYGLFVLGPSLERFFGRGRFILLYFLAAFSGNVFSFLLTGEQGYSVGASTSIFGLVAAQGIFIYQNREVFGRQSRGAIQNVVVVVVLNLLFGRIVTGIDNWGHVGGLLGGALFTWFAGPRWEVEGIFPNLKMEDRREFREVVFGAGAVIILFGGLAMLGFMLA
jgi:rhomboid protease GluP